MRYFSRGWVNGDLDDDECDQVSKAYEARLTEIAPRLPESLVRLAREVSLHDAVIESITWSPSLRVLTLELIAGDLQRGYHAATLTYSGALLGEQRLETLRSVGRDREACVLYDEVDLGTDGLLVHRILFWPREELTIDFEALELTVADRADRRVLMGNAFQEINAAEEDES
jgi:hypothetical protein